MAQILILTSDRQVGRNIRQYLSLKAHSAAVFTDPQAAILAADAHPPRLAVVDLMLAGRSGIEFLYELRSYPEWQGIPAILIGQQQASEIRIYQPAFKQLNIASYLPLPLTPLAELEAQIQSLLQPA